MKVLFFFGSGADTDANSELKSGASFAEELIKNKYDYEVNSLLGEGYRNYRFLYPQSTRFFVQTVVDNVEKAKLCLTSQDIKKCILYKQGNSEIKYDCIKEICSNWYKITMDEIEDKKIKKFFLENAVLCDAIDGKFNSLRYAELNGDAKRVIRAYTTIFVSMLKNLYDFDASFKWKYEDIFDLLQKHYQKTTYDENCYYNLLGKALKNNYRIVTTNYTSLVEQLTRCETVYLHGKLTLFEDLDKLMVYDCTDKDNISKLSQTDKIIPFILIPSGVKPIICKKQIEAFSKFVNYLDETSLLIVVGYKFNSEDNHINSIIAEWLKNSSDNKLIYFNYENCVDFSRFAWLQPIAVNNIKQYQDFDSNQCEQIFNICVDETNSRKAFEYVIGKCNEDNLMDKIGKRKEQL